MTPRPGYRYVSSRLQPSCPALLSLPITKSAEGKPPPGWKHHFPPHRLLILRGKGPAITAQLLSCKEKMNERGGVGHQFPADFRVESVQLKCILLELSGSISTEPPLSPSKLLLPTARQAATKQAVVMEPECRVLALPTAPETPLCLPTSPLFKNKTKSPTPRQPSSIQDTKEGQTVVGRTLHMLAA